MAKPGWWGKIFLKSGSVLIAWAILFLAGHFAAYASDYDEKIFYCYAVGEDGERIEESLSAAYATVDFDTGEPVITGSFWVSEYGNVAAYYVENIVDGGVYEIELTELYEDFGLMRARFAEDNADLPPMEQWSAFYPAYQGDVVEAVYLTKDSGASAESIQVELKEAESGTEAEFFEITDTGTSDQGEEGQSEDIFREGTLFPVACFAQAGGNALLKAICTGDAYYALSSVYPENLTFYSEDAYMEGFDGRVTGMEAVPAANGGELVSEAQSASGVQGRGEQQNNNVQPGPRFPAGLVAGIVLIICAAVIAIIFVLKNKKPQEAGQGGGINNISLTDNSETECDPPDTIAAPIAFSIIGIAGGATGISFIVPAAGLNFGRDPSNQVVFDPNERGISRIHCRLCPDGYGGLLLDDLGSRYGTYLATGERLIPGQPAQLVRGSVFYLGSQQIGFRVQ